MQIKQFRWLLVIPLTLLLVVACAQAESETEKPSVEVSEVTYEASDEDFTNPERGFYADSYFNTE